MRYFHTWITIFLMAVFAFGGAANAEELTGLIESGVSDLGLLPGNQSLCVITNASFVRLNGATTEKYADTIREVTGCSIGKGNLFFFHSPINADLNIALVRLDTFACVMITANDTSSIKQGPVSLAFDRLNDEASWNEIQTVLGKSNAFKITGLAHHIAAGAPYDFMKCAELHNHICPGGTSGYFIANYILANYPLKDGESYTYISCPPWCKDDFIQVILDLTSGKRGYFVKGLSDTDEKCLPDPNAAGILIVHHGKGSRSEATAYVFSYDWEEAKKVSGAENLTGLQSTMRAITGLIPYYATPERLVSVTREYAISEETAQRLTQAGVTPYRELGYSK